jgi:hypothetical protein
MPAGSSVRSEPGAQKPSILLHRASRPLG